MKIRKIPAGKEQLTVRRLYEYDDDARDSEDDGDGGHVLGVEHEEPTANYEEDVGQDSDDSDHIPDTPTRTQSASSGMASHGAASDELIVQYHEAAPVHFDQHGREAHILLPKKISGQYHRDYHKWGFAAIRAVQLQDGAVVAGWCDGSCGDPDLCAMRSGIFSGKNHSELSMSETAACLRACETAS